MSCTLKEMREIRKRNPSVKPYVNGDASGPEWTAFVPAKVRAVWMCPGCRARVTAPIETHIYGTPFCPNCNGHFAMESVEVT